MKVNVLIWGDLLKVSDVVILMVESGKAETGYQSQGISIAIVDMSPNK